MKQRLFAYFILFIFLFSMSSALGDATETSEKTSSSPTETVNFIDQVLTNKYVSLAAILVGFVSGFMAIKDFFEKKKAAPYQEEANEIIKASRDGRISKAEAERLSLVVKEMNDQVMNSIPIEAERMLIENKLRGLTDEIYSLYDEHVYLSKKYHEYSQTHQLRPEVIKYIQHELKRGMGAKRALTSSLSLGIFSIAAFLFLFNTEIVRELVYRLIDWSGARINSWHVFFYLLGLLLTTIIASALPKRGIELFVASHKKRSFVIMLFLLVIAAFSLYAICYDIFYVTYWMQIVAGVVSLILFVSGFILMRLWIDSIRFAKKSYFSVSP